MLGPHHSLGVGTLRLLAAIMVLVSCNDVATGPGKDESRTASRLSLVSGDAQTALVATRLPQELVVQVSDSAGRPVPDISIAWAVAEGSGSLSAESTSTDAAGQASVSWTLGTRAGRQLATATVAGLAPVHFRVDAQAGPPARINKVGGDAQRGYAGQALSDTLVAKVTDAYGNPVRGQVVTWRVASGGGSLDAPADTTDAAGVIRTRWRLGTESGKQMVDAQIGALSAIWSAIAVVPVLAAQSGDGQIGLVGSALADSITVRAVDQKGSPAAGVVIRWKVQQNGGRVSPDSSVTDSLGVARARWVLGEATGVQRVEASTYAATKAILTATADNPASLRLDPGGNTGLTEGPTDFNWLVRPAGRIRAVMVFVDFMDAPASEKTHDLYDVFVPKTVQYYEDVSYGKVKLEIDAVHKWYRLPKASRDYSMSRATVTGQSHRDFTEAAVRAADADVDFSRVDMVLVVASANSKVDFSPGLILRPQFAIHVDGTTVRHGAALGGDARERNYWRAVPILVHEIGHVFGLPDLAVPNAEDPHGFAGTWDLMGWNGFTPHFLAWHKQKMGWLDPSQIKSLRRGGIEVILTPLSAPGGTKAVVITTGPSTAHVIEARAPLGLDSQLCDHGVLIYSVDARVETLRGPIRVHQSQRGTDPVKISRCASPYAATFDSRAGKVARFADTQSGVVVEVLGRVGDGYRVRIVKK